MRIAIDPGTVLMRKLHLRTKLLMLFPIFLLPILMLATNELPAGAKAVEQTDHEIQGAVIAADR